MTRTHENESKNSSKPVPHVSLDVKPWSRDEEEEGKETRTTKAFRIILLVVIVLIILLSSTNVLLLLFPSNLPTIQFNSLSVSTHNNSLMCKGNFTTTNQNGKFNTNLYNIRVFVTTDYALGLGRSGDLKLQPMKNAVSNFESINWGDKMKKLSESWKDDTVVNFNVTIALQVVLMADTVLATTLKKVLTCGSMPIHFMSSGNGVATLGSNKRMCVEK